MIRKSPLLAGLVALLLASVPCLAEVEVRFVDPERYTDAEVSGPRSREATLAEFRVYFAWLGRRFLAPGQSLTIEVLDIDLAGQLEIWRRSLDENPGHA